MPLRRKCLSAGHRVPHVAPCRPYLRYLNLLEPEIQHLKPNI